MPRRPRLDHPGLPQHVIQRGNNRGACCRQRLLLLQTAVNLGIGVGDARFWEELEAAGQAKKKVGCKRKDEHAQVGEQVDLF